MTSLSILIVEDEILIAETISMYLEERGHSVQGIAISYVEALKAFHQKRPDLVLLDIRLYGERSGLDFARYLLGLEDHPPFIYLTSQYDRRIVEKALVTNPSGYLTKPINKQTLWTTIETAAAKIMSHCMSIYDGKTYHIISITDILYIQADHVYVRVHTTDGGVIMARKSMKQLLSEINSNDLIYCHRSYVVNLRFVRKWATDVLELSNGAKIPMSRSRREDLLSRIKTS